MYEDAEIEHAAFHGKGRVFSIASAGSTALRLADKHELVVCDINPAQLAYAERRANGGRVETGDAERAMNFVRAFMPLVGWRAGVVRTFLALSDVAEQMTFWRTRGVRVAIPLFLAVKIWHRASETAGEGIRTASKRLEPLRAGSPPRRSRRGAPAEDAKHTIRPG
jgi:hypothetical protein